VDVVAFTDIGTTRKENQDSYWCALLEVEGVPTVVAAVADGMGGLDDGAYASRYLLQTIEKVAYENPKIEAFKTAVLKANHELYNSSETRRGTTLTLALLAGGSVSILHIGDSRAYHYADNHPDGLVLTEDHTVLTKWRTNGVQITEDMAKSVAGQLYRCIGVREDIEVDVIYRSYQPGDKFLLCTDGFWHHLKENPTVQTIPSMIEQMKTNGETDNITAVLIEV